MEKAKALLLSLQEDSADKESFNLEHYLEKFKEVTGANLPYASIMRKLFGLTKGAGNIDTYLQVLLCPKADHYGGQSPLHGCEKNNNNGKSNIFQTHSILTIIFRHYLQCPWVPQPRLLSGRQ